MMVGMASRAHDSVNNQISLGDTKEKVIALLEPTQKYLSRGLKKRPEQFLRDGEEIYIYFARTSRQADGLTTDDEFTPYVFRSGKLVAIGWSALGGPSSHGQATSDTYINIQNAPPH